MIYRFRIVSDEVDDFKREIIIDSNSTFLELHDAICDATGFDKAQMSSFFLCEDNWEKYQEITLEDMGQESDSSEDVYLMADSVIGDSLDDTDQKLLFTFDYLTDRSLFMKLIDITTGKNLPKPECVVSNGDAPLQNVDFDEFEASQIVSDTLTGNFDDDDEMYGSTEYNDDEVDFDNMSIDLPE